MTHRKKLSKLRRVTDLAFTAQQGVLAQLQAEFDALGRQLATLDQQRKTRAGALGQEADIAFRVGADMAWLRWVEQRKTVINTQRAQIAARIEQEKEALKLAFGRDQATRALCAQSRRRKTQTF